MPIDVFSNRHVSFFFVLIMTFIVGIVAFSCQKIEVDPDDMDLDKAPGMVERLLREAEITERSKSAFRVVAVTNTAIAKDNEDGSYNSVEVGDFFPTGSEIRVAAGVMELYFIDGTVVVLAPGSWLKITAIEYDPETGIRRFSFDQARGTVWYRPFHDNQLADSRIRVKAPGLDTVTDDGSFQVRICAKGGVRVQSFVRQVSVIPDEKLLKLPPELQETGLPVAERHTIKLYSFGLGPSESFKTFKDDDSVKWSTFRRRLNRSINMMEKFAQGNPVSYRFLKSLGVDYTDMRPLKKK